MQSVHTGAYNLHGGGGTARNAYDRALAYIEWTNTAVRMIGNQFSNGDLDRLVLTLLTCGTGRSTRARNAGLQVVKLNQDIGEEPK